MRYSKIPAMVLPFMLAGCLDLSDEDQGSFYAPAPAPVVAAPAAVTSTPAISGQEGCGCPEKPSPVPPPPTVPGSPPVTEWHPLEGDLVRAGDLVMELKKSAGGTYPSPQKMSAHLQANMGLTDSQAEKVLDELGL